MERALCCVVLFISACVTPPTKPHSPPVMPETSNRGQERWRMMYERVVKLALEDSFPHTADDGSLQFLVNEQSFDPMFDEDMRIVEICRRAIAKDDPGLSMTRDEWTAIFIAMVARVSIDKARAAVAYVCDFHHPELIQDDAWCFWYIRDGKRRELVVDPLTRDISQSVEWR